LIPLVVGRRSPLAVNKYRPLQLGQIPEDRPIRDLGLGDETARDDRTEHADIEIGGMIADEQRRPRRRHSSADFDVNIEQPAAKAVIGHRNDAEQAADLKCQGNSAYGHGRSYEKHVARKPPRRAIGRTQRQLIDGLRRNRRPPHRPGHRRSGRHPRVASLSDASSRV
jgi:hypothetical protein